LPLGRSTIAATCSPFRRALKEAHKIGAKRVKVGPDGVIDILLNDGDMAAPLAPDQQEPGPIRIRRHAKKRMDF
jgi:hypothetical protein